MDRPGRSGDEPLKRPLDYRALGLLAFFLVLLGLLFITPAYPGTDQHVDHRDIVAAAKRQVVNELRLNPDAPAADECARWEITRRVVIMLSGEGAGHIRKGGNNCRGYAVDAIMYHDGTVVDVLGDGPEGPNTPHWIIQPDKRPMTDWAPPVDLDPPAGPGPTPVPEPTPGGPELAAIEDKLDQILYQIEQLRQQQAADTERLNDRMTELTNNAKRSASKLLPLLSAGSLAACAGAAAK